MSVAQRRQEQVDKAMTDVKALCAKGDVTRETLAEIEKVMLELVAQEELFPEEEFGIPADEKIRLYRLAEDEDGRFALYFHAANTPAEVGPHNHTTWACIAGLAGEERNFFYDTDRQSEPAYARTQSVRKGEAISLLPDDVHSIQAVGENGLRNLHLYGLAIDQLYDRVFWNADEKRWTPIPPTSGIIERRVQ